MLGLLAGGFTLATPLPAQAAITTSNDPVALGKAMAADPAIVTAGVLHVPHVCDADKCPTAISNTAMTGFPDSGADFAVMSTGNALHADDPNNSESTSTSLGVPFSAISSDAFDIQILRVDLTAATGNCLAFDFRFLSEEYPEYVNKGYNDAFVAQLNHWQISGDPTTQTLSAPGDFAAGAGDAISVDAAGPSSMSAAEAAGSTYDGATLRLVARTPVVPGTINVIYLTLFDQGDPIYDSAVFLDNLRYETLAAGQCKSLALDPFEGQTGLDPATAGKPTVNKKKTTISQPMTCVLPPGPIGCNVVAQMVFKGQTQFAGVNARAAIDTVMGATNVSIPAGSTATVKVSASGAGAKIIKKARAFPKKLLRKAAALEQKARKVGVNSPKGKKLIKKAVKLRKKAAKLAKQKTLGYLTLRIVNPSNGAVESSARIRVKR